MPGCDLIIKDPNKGPRVAGIKDGGTIKELANYAVDTQIADFPPDVIEYARIILLDTIGVILGGSVEPEATAMARRMGCEAGGQSTLIGHPLRTSALNAALVNGTAATWLDYDSGHRPPPGKPLLPAAHPPAHLVPAALAVAEATGASGDDLLGALVVGYDAGARVSMASRLRAEIHPHGTCHNVSAAVAAARLAGLDAELMESTIGLAVHMAIMPSFENAYQGRTVRNTYAGIGAAVGVLTSQLVLSGFLPERDALGSVYGEVISPWLDRERITEGLGERFEITQGFIKPYPMCRFGHPAVEATVALINRHPLNPEEIEEVEVYTFDWAATLDDPTPATDLGAKFSIPWAVGTVLVRKSAGADDFRNKSLGDPALRSMAAKILVREDPDYSAMTPGKRPARVSVRTKAGDVYTSEVEGSGGGPDAPLPRHRIHEKFRSLAEPVIGPERAAAVIEKIEEMEKMSDIRQLTRLLRHQRLSTCRS